MYYLTALAIVKNERPEYVMEWYDYHKSLGVEHFTFLNHVPNDIPLPKSLDVPNVKILNCGPSRQQAFFYAEALKTINAFWTVVIDIDEFVLCKKSLPEFLEAYEKYDAVAANWLVFGSSYHEHSVFPVLEKYKWRTDTNNPINQHIKSIVRPQKVKWPIKDPHYFHVNTVNENFEKVTCPTHDYSGEQIRINHYFCRSKEDWQCKIDRGRADCELLRDWTEFNEINAACFYDENPTGLR